MKFFFDTEFAEKPYTIQLISIGIVSEDGCTFYAESTEFDPADANDWVKKNVLPHLRLEGGLLLDNAAGYPYDITMKGTRRAIGKAIVKFVGEAPEFWSYRAAYDWVVFCWLFGAMPDLPEHFPKFCLDIKQVIEEKGSPEKPKMDDVKHDALADAKYHKILYDWITEL